MPSQLEWSGFGTTYFFSPPVYFNCDGSSSYSRTQPYVLFGAQIQAADIVGGAISSAEANYVVDTLIDRSTTIRIVGDVFARLTDSGIGERRLAIFHAGLLRQDVSDDLNTAFMVVATPEAFDADWLRIERRLFGSPPLDSPSAGFTAAGAGTRDGYVHIHFDIDTKRLVEKNEVIALYLQASTWDGNAWTNGPEVTCFQAHWAFRVLHTE